MTVASTVADDIAHDANLTRVSEIISSSVKWSAAAGLVPLPVIDLVALGAVQATMLMKLSDAYGQPFGKEAANSIVSVLLGTLLPGMAAGAVMGSAIKFAPVGGTLTGIVAMAGFGTAATYAVGKVFARHLARGGKPSTFSAEAIKDELKAEFQGAKARTAS